MVFGAGEATEAVPRRWIDIAQAALKLAIKVAPQKLSIASRASADINHRELLSARRRGLTRV